MKTSPNDCWAVLRAAKEDFLGIMAKVSDSAPNFSVQLTFRECRLVLYYLEAIVILRHLQRPGVVENMMVGAVRYFGVVFCRVSTMKVMSVFMQVEEWKNRSQVQGGFVSIVIKEHKTATHQVASFVLSSEEEAVNSLDLYHRQSNRKMS